MPVQINLQQMSLPQLQQMAQGLGLPTTGGQSQLVAAISQALGVPAPSSFAGYGPANQQFPGPAFTQQQTMQQNTAAYRSSQMAAGQIPPPQLTQAEVAKVKADRDVAKAQEKAAELLGKAAEEQRRGAERFFGQIGAGVSAVGMMGTRGVNAASPSQWATLTGSVTLLEASLGRLLLPAVDRFSLAVQKGARWIDSMPKSVAEPVMLGAAAAAFGYRYGGGLRGATLGAGLGLAIGSPKGTAAEALGYGMTTFAGLSPFMGGYAAIPAGLVAAGRYAFTDKEPSQKVKEAAAELDRIRQAGDSSWERRYPFESTDSARERHRREAEKGLADATAEQKRLDEIVNPDDRLLRAYRGLPTPGIYSYQGYGDQLQMAALQGNELDNKIMMDQLRELTRLGTLIEKVVDNTDATARAAPPWR